MSKKSVTVGCRIHVGLDDLLQWIGDLDLTEQPWTPVQAEALSDFIDRHHWLTGQKSSRRNDKYSRRWISADVACALKVGDRRLFAAIKDGLEDMLSDEDDDVRADVVARLRELADFVEASK